ncbi:MAG TPA: hypothetical protein VIS74_04060 [Chthoniobacterales bacterium]
MNPVTGEQPVAAFSWGAGVLLLLIGLQAAAILQIPPKNETGVRVIPWKAPDLEIAAPEPEKLPEYLP